MAEKKTVQEAIKEILQLRGKEIFKNIKHFWALLDDLVPESTKERKIIKKNLDEELLEVFIDDSKTVKHRIKILQDNLEDLGMTQDWSDFIIESFGLPLGWSQEIREMKLDRQSSSVTAQTPADKNANYEDIILDEEGLRKLGITDKKSLTTLNIPATFNTFIGTVYRITKIDDNIFKDCDKLETVTIPDTVTEIGIGAFEGCKSLKSINIPNEVTKIENNVFRGCSALTKMIIPNKVAEIGDESFADCELLENILLPDSVIAIGDCAFKNCINAFKDNVIIPNSTICLSLTAFDGCEKIEHFTIPVSMSAFKALKVKEVTLDENVLKQLGYDVDYKEKGTDKQKLVSFKKNGQDVTSLDIPAIYTYEGKKYKITEIADRAFDSCKSLISVIMPDSIIDLGKSSFAGCSSLKSVAISNNVTNIYNSFGGCTSLTSVTIPNSVTKIDYCAFYNCKSLKTLIIPDSVTNIGESAFRKCPSLKNVTLPDSVKNIGDSAFADCSSLTISIPKNCSYRGYISSSRNDNSIYSFYKCKDVTQRA